jgi:excinuclease Cho
LFAALVDSQVEVWPFHGPVDVIEESGAWVQKHRVNNWCYLGTWCSQTGAAAPLVDFKSTDFDLDSYKILVKPIMLQSVRLESVQP